MPAIKNREKILQLVNEVPEQDLGKVVSLMEKLKKPNKNIPEKYLVADKIYSPLLYINNYCPFRPHFR